MMLACVARFHPGIRFSPVLQGEKDRGPGTGVNSAAPEKIRRDDPPIRCLFFLNNPRSMNDPLELLRAEISSMREAQNEQFAQLKVLEQRLVELGRASLLGSRLQRGILLETLAAADGRHSDPLSLTRSYGQVYSQNGEDGMIAEIFRRIGTKDRFFVEIGIENGLQCNTRLLLESGWRGVWLEGNDEHVQNATRVFRPYIDSGALRILGGMIGPDNIEAAMDEGGVPAAFDFLSLDIDQHTHTVWRVMRRRARVACIEYNSSIPPSLPLEVPFNPANGWERTNWFGAGLKAMEGIGRAQGMALVGCELVGSNAFFVAEGEAAGRFREPFTAETHYQPPCYHLVAHAGHPPPAKARSWKTAEEFVQPTGDDGASARTN